MSLWWDTLPEDLQTAHRPVLSRDLDVDIAIVGAGYTGLWTAYYLTENNPDLSIAVIDAHVVGFGASGRNGGWCSALFPTSIDKLARYHGNEAGLAMQHAMHDTVAEVGRVIRHEAIDCDWQSGGTITLARSPLQSLRASEEIAAWRRWGFGPADYDLLDRDSAQQRVGATNVLGATYTPHCASLHPAKLVRSLANLVESRGVSIYENTTAMKISPGHVETSAGNIKATVIVRATEGYTPSLKGHRRAIAPVYSLMLATEPLSDSVWDEIGLSARETFTDFRNLIIYGQRTADNRLAFGGRGAPYHFGSRITPAFDHNEHVHSALHDVLLDLFPRLQGARVTHRWGGPLGIARDWMASCGLDSRTGLAWSGGYVGDGVGTSNLGGRTLAHLITAQTSELTKLPWVNHRSPRWEPEPLRWMGANAGLQAMTIADMTEARTGKPSRLANMVNKFLGH